VKLSEFFQRAQRNSLGHLGGVTPRFAAILFLIILATAGRFLRSYEFSFPTILLLLTISAVTNLFIFIWIGWGKGLHYVPYFAVSLDVSLITLGVHYLGGVESPISWIYAVCIMTVALVHGFRMSIYAALLCSLMYSTLLFAESTGLIKRVNFGLLNPVYYLENKVYFYVKLICDNCLFLITGLFSGFISEQLIRSKETLGEQNEQLNLEIAERIRVEEGLRRHREELEELVTNRTAELSELVDRLQAEIAERKNMEEALRQSEQRYATTLDAVPDMVFEATLDGTIIYANRSASEMFGYSLDEVGTINFSDLLNEEGIQTALRVKDEMTQEGEPSQSAFYEVRSADGRAIPVEAHARILKREGQPEKVLGVARDITERIEAEKILRESEEKYRTLLDSLEVGFYETDLDGNLLFFNDTMRKTLGYQEVELKGTNFREFVGEKDAGIMYRAFNAVYKTGIAEKSFNSTLISKDGTKKPIEFSVSLVHNNDGRSVGFRGVARDISEKKQLEQQLLQSQKMESIGTLAGGIAHDFNNLLSGILGYASLMKGRIREDDPFFKYVDIIEKSSLRASELTAQLLAFARGGKYDIKPINLNKVVDETLKIIARTLDKSVEIETKLYPQLPTVDADAGQLQQVLLNLCVNAGDSMPAGGRLTIETNIEEISEEYAKVHIGAEPGQYILWSVSDTGIGMDERTRKRIFEPFFTTKEEGKGTGLGLSMVYGVIKNHGGYISVYSELGHGATFKIYLPISGKPESEKLPETEKPHGGNETVLVVDDEESFRSLAKDALESHGYQVLLAVDGERAIDIYREQNGNIKLVILDMVMPKMGGHETFLRMRAFNPNVRVLLSTGYSQNGKAQEIMDSGVKGFIQKPYKIDALLLKVRSVLDSD